MISHSAVTGFIQPGQRAQGPRTTNQLNLFSERRRGAASHLLLMIATPEALPPFSPHQRKYHYVQEPGFIKPWMTLMTG